MRETEKDMRKSKQSERSSWTEERGWSRRDGKTRVEGRRRKTKKSDRSRRCDEKNRLDGKEASGEVGSREAERRTSVTQDCSARVGKRFPARQAVRLRRTRHLRASTCIGVGETAGQTMTPQ